MILIRKPSWKYIVPIRIHLFSWYPSWRISTHYFVPLKKLRLLITTDMFSCLKPASISCLIYMRCGMCLLLKSWYFCIDKNKPIVTHYRFVYIHTYAYKCMYKQAKRYACIFAHCRHVCTHTYTKYIPALTKRHHTYTSAYANTTFTHGELHSNIDRGIANTHMHTPRTYLLTHTEKAVHSHAFGILIHFSGKDGTKT